MAPKHFLFPNYCWWILIIPESPFFSFHLLLVISAGSKEYKIGKEKLNYDSLLKQDQF